MKKKRILLVEPERLTRFALARLLEDVHPVQIVGEVETTTEALEFLANYPREIDVVLSEIALRNSSGLKLLHEMRQRHWLFPIIFVSRVEALDVVKAALLGGAAGYVLKRGEFSDLQEALKIVGTERKYVPSQLPGLSSVPRNYYELGKNHVPDPLANLSMREREVFHLIASGSSSRKIARKLSIAIRTAEVHRANVVQKLGLNSSAEVIRYAFIHGLVSD